jgi:hypothetical protein
MLIGAMVLAGLVLLVLVADRGTAHMTRGADAGSLVYCRPCDLRYPRGELLDGSLCPRGHHLTAASRGFSLSTVLIAACIAFIALGALLVATGAVATR